MPPKKYTKIVKFTLTKDIENNRYIYTDNNGNMLQTKEAVTEKSIKYFYADVTPKGVRRLSRIEQTEYLALNNLEDAPIDLDDEEFESDSSVSEESINTDIKEKDIMKENNERK